MRSIRKRLHPVADGDRGMTLVEVMVAMFVFAILSTLVLSSLVQILTQNRDSRARHAAANLAATEIELAHDTEDLFALPDRTIEVTVNGTDFQVTRESAWVTESVSEAACGMGGGNLRYKRVHITVTWDGMRAGAPPVRSDTLVDPINRINDPSRGTMLVSIVDAQGNGVSGARATLTATSGGAGVLTAAPSDPQGCIYFLQVPAGTYDLTVAKSGYIGITQEQTLLERNVGVQAGTTSSIGLQYDLAATLRATLAPGAPGSVRLPRDLPLTLVSTYGINRIPLTSAATTTATHNVLFHPHVTYRAFIGDYGRDTGAECVSADPSEWPEATLLGVGLAAGVASELSAAPGGAVALDIPMGLVRVDSRITDLRATPAPGPLGTPPCGASFVYRYGDVPSGSTVALPFGSWRLTNGSSGSVSATVLSRGSNLLGVVTVDPREPAP